MPDTADNANRQIRKRKYGLDLPGCRRIIGYGVAMHQKDAFAKAIMIL